MSVAVGSSLAVPGWGGTSSAEEKACIIPSFVAQKAADRPGHHHPRVRVLVYKRNPDLTAPVHYPLQFLRPEPGLGIEKKKADSSSAAEAEETLREIHVHDDGWKTLHVERNAARPYRLCDLIELWSSSSPTFRSIWRNNGVAGAHVWIDGYHIPYIRLEELMRIPLDHDLSITICIEESIPM